MNEKLIPNEFLLNSTQETLMSFDWEASDGFEYTEENENTFRVSRFTKPDEYILVNKVNLDKLKEVLDFTLEDIINPEDLHAMTFEERLELLFSTWVNKLKFDDLKREHVDLSVNDYLLNIEIKSHPFYKGIIHVRIPFTINEICK